MRYQLTYIFAAASLAVLPGFAHSAVIAADNFESYDADVQVKPAAGAGLNGGYGFTSAYNVPSANSTVIITNRTGAAIEYSKGDVHLNGGNRALRFGEGAAVTGLVTRPFAAQTGTVYFSFLYRTNNDALSEDFVQIGLANANNTEPDLSVGTQNDNNTPSKFFVRSSTGTSDTTIISGTALAQATTYLVVGKIEKTVAGGNYNKVSLFLDPDSYTEPGSALVSKTKTSGTASLSYFSLRTARLEAGDYYFIDNLTIGTTFASVIPEPASVLLAAGGAMLLLRRRHTKPLGD